MNKLNKLNTLSMNLSVLKINYSKQFPLINWREENFFTLLIESINFFFNLMSNNYFLHPPLIKKILNKFSTSLNSRLEIKMIKNQIFPIQ